MVDVGLIGFEPTFEVISRYQLQFSNLSGLAATGPFNYKKLMAEEEGVEPSRDWILLTIFKIAATTNWLVLPLYNFIAVRKGVEPLRDWILLTT